MLNWSKIDNEKTFQNLVNHLFFLECPSVYGFVPFSPYIGKDGGWDGKYEGCYPKEKLEGKYCIQAKYTKHNLNNAMPSLIKWAVKELEKARKNQADHLRLATCADLREEHITKLESLNKGFVKTFKIWHGHDLLLRIEMEPFLRAYYFGSPAIPLFVPSSIYFKEVERNLIDFVVPAGIKSIEDRIDEVVAFLNNDKKKIFVIHAFGGFGKSHFLRQFPIKTIVTHHYREIWFIRDGVQDIRVALNDEIGVRDSDKKKHKYIFVLDDADRANDIKEILDCITKSGIDAKIIFSLRTVGLSVLEEIIDSVRCRDLTVVTSIPQWPDDELIMLLRTVAQKPKVDEEAEIVKKYSNPFFIVRIGLNIRGQQKYDFQSIKQSILQSLLYDTRKILSTEKIDVEIFLLHLALITPINISDSQTISKFAQKVNVDGEKIINILEKLSTKGVLRSIGSLLRFIPDMIGDVYLLEKMQTITDDDRKQVFIYWLDTHSKNIFCNLGATLKYGEKDCLVSVVTDVVSGWINNSDNYESYEKRLVLENLEEICYLIPDKALDMLWEFIKDSSLSTDVFGPTIVRLIHSDCEREKIVKIIEGLRNRVKEGTYSNYKPDNLVIETVTPLRNSVEKKIMPILSIIENSMKRTEPIIEFATIALQEVLASAHEWTHSTYARVQFGSRTLKATESVLLMRNKAIEIVKGMLLDTRSEIRLAAIAVVEAIGECNIGHDASTDSSLKDKIAEEKQEILEFVEENKFISKEIDINVLNAYEDLLFVWWSRHDVPDEKSLALLYQFKYSPEYRIFRCYSSKMDISNDIRDKLKDVPIKDRWPWFVNNIMRKKWYLTIKDFEKDAIALNEKYPSPADIANFLNWLGKAIKTPSTNALFLSAWFQKNPEIFKQIRMQKDLWLKIPVTFKYTITYDLIHNYPEMVKTIIDEALLSPIISIEEAKITVDPLIYSVPVPDRYKIIKSVAEKNIDELNLTIMERIGFVGDKISSREMSEIVSILLNHLSRKAQDRSIYFISFILHKKTKEYINDFIGGTSKILKKILVDIGKLHYHDYELVSRLFPDIKEFLNFIEARLLREKEINQYSEYRAVPYQGISIINKFISNKEEFLFAIRKTLEWNKIYRDIANYSISELSEQLMSLKDDSNILFFERVKTEFYNKENFEDCLLCIDKLPLKLKTINIFKEIIQNSIELGLEKGMIKLLEGKTLPEGVWTSSIGQTPPAFIEKKKCFEELRNSVPSGKLRSALDDCVRSVDQLIEHHIVEEENRFHSR